MNPLLRNPVYHSLCHNDRHLGYTIGQAAYFHEKVSPFAGFEEGYEKGFDDLYNALPAGRTILYATPQRLEPPTAWKLAVSVEGLQFLFEGGELKADASFQPTPLTTADVPQMVELARLAKPGPFGLRTIEFGHYYGVFEDGKLVAMTGQRLHINQFNEVSAVCTHPDYLGKGYATALVQHQVNLIRQQGKIPFLHVRADNNRAIAVYERLGFVLQGTMNFCFLKK